MAQNLLKNQTCACVSNGLHNSQSNWTSRWPIGCAHAPTRAMQHACTAVWRRGVCHSSISSPAEMKRIVVSVVSLVWMLFSTSSLAFILISLFSNGWLQRVEIDGSIWETNCQTILPPTSPSAFEAPYYASPSLGPVFSCETACPGHIPARSLRWVWNSGARVYCRLSLWGGGQKPAVSNAAAWTGSVLLLSGSGILMLAHSLLCLSLCKRELCGRSVFQVTGLLQCVADLLLLAGLFAWPAGWASIPVQEVCGASTAPYQKGNCEWTQNPILNFVGVCLLFVSAILATFADRSIMQASVMRQMLITDKQVIFV